MNADQVVAEANRLGQDSLNDAQRHLIAEDVVARLRAGEGKIVVVSLLRQDKHLDDSWSNAIEIEHWAEDGVLSWDVNNAHHEGVLGDDSVAKIADSLKPWLLNDAAVWDEKEVWNASADHS